MFFTENKANLYNKRSKYLLFSCDIKSDSTLLPKFHTFVSVDKSFLVAPDTTHTEIILFKQIIELSANYFFIDKRHDC
ncbi:hypothetical protein COY87_05645 [Candidatus Roizmanbacteria bacterium CG_4_10_14_0_8_um_filter_33_9]|uniref:Uncharacterized protein n=1 Tax=Candidatus Roizmanbacteria bacterium CG_4_10_14_0_8_um_filter_33_9 TaxID=1974826 RepID=A0A2M7QHN6_9BACT|nr:MAG: hypothetical protein COY87_05645 [Candidatus Roizmanbacteria bacterium CG_4_10_14_0_8_um_filter_33_9]